MGLLCRWPRPGRPEAPGARRPHRSASSVFDGASFCTPPRTFGVFWASEVQRDYSNVLPGEPALSHLDAGRIRFGPDARLDFANSARYKDSELHKVRAL